MDSVEYIKLKRLPFMERVDALDDFLASEREKGSLLGRMGIPPVSDTQKYYNQDTKEFFEVIMLGSNNYLGLANEQEVKDEVAHAVQQWGVGTGGSPAFSGYTQQQAELERRLAGLSGHESAILVNGGYMANLTWVTSLIGKDDIVIYDKNSHASVLDAMKLSGIRHAFSFNPERLEMLEQIINHAAKDYPEGQIFMTVEGVRSIDGSVVDLKGVLDITKKYGDRIFVMLDDAHGLGTLGKHGYGTMEYCDLMGSVNLRMSTCSKALGMQGAFLTGSGKIINYIRNTANSYNFTTAISQPVMAGINSALNFIEKHPDRLAKLHENKRYLQNHLKEMGYNIYCAPSGIIPIFIPGAPCEQINRYLYESGLFVNVMSYPMIAPGQERIRISAMATMSQSLMDRALSIFHDAGKKYNII